MLSFSLSHLYNYFHLNILQDFERQLAEERRRNQEKEERKREAERLQERGGWNVLEKDPDHQGSDEDMDLDHNKGADFVAVSFSRRWFANSLNVYRWRNSYS